MQPSIQVLSDEAINQIAAGEVIESPASVVKELVENALDADAKNIRIEITGGGLKMIRITDDGKGMHPIDAPLSILPHATSKIQKAQDLFTVTTKGFRGEALPSIASISKMTMTTAIEGESGIKLEIEKGEVGKKSPCARVCGTTIEVNSLFYNVPPRKKFQKTATAISAEIFRMITHLALSHPEVGFTLISNGRKALNVPIPNGSLEEQLEMRANQLLGEDFTRGSFPLEFEEGPMRFFGLVGAPTNTRTNRMGQYLFINRRAVQCKAIEEAVRAGYGTRLDERRHPIFLLHLEVPGDLVDVNVHPQKLEVRLRKQELFDSCVEQAVEKALAVRVEPVKMEGSRAFQEIEVNFDQVSLRLQEEAPEEIELALEESDFAVIGQFSKYLLIDFFGKGVQLVDLEAARFRVLFEDLLKENDGSVASQGLLIPFSIDVTSVEGAMILTHMAAIEEMGISLRPIGKDVFMVEALPPFVDQADVKLLVTDMAHAMQEFIGKSEYTKQRREKLALLTASCAKRRTFNAGEEAKGLVKRLFLCDSPLHCPKGNPTMVHLDEETIESLFTADQKAPKGAKC